VKLILQVFSRHMSNLGFHGFQILSQSKIILIHKLLKTPEVCHRMLWIMFLYYDLPAPWCTLWVSTILIVHLPQNSLPQKLVYDLLGLIQSNFPFFSQENMKNWMNPVFQVVMLVQLNFVMISDCWLIGCAEVLVGHSISIETTFVNIEWKRTNFYTYLAIAHKTKYAVVPIHTEECWSRHLVTPDCLCVCIICSDVQGFANP